MLSLGSVGCGSSKEAVSKDIYKLFEETLKAKEKAEERLKLYTNLVRRRDLYDTTTTSFIRS